MALFGWSDTSTLIVIGIAIFFVLAIINRQLNNLGVAFNGLVCYGAFAVVYLLLGLLLSIKIALIGGIIAGLVGGFFGSMFFGGDEGGE